MKLKLLGIDFTDDTITFSIPHEIMEVAIWKGGFAEVDLSEISDHAEEFKKLKDTIDEYKKEQCGCCDHV